MNFYNIIQNILSTSSRHNNVKEVSEGDIYVYLNSGEHKYPCVFLTVGEVTDSEMSRNVNCTLFYVDRLVSDQSNRTAIQSLGITTLGDILDTIEGDIVSVSYTTFTEKFTDMCGGVFASVNITYPLDEMCDEHFEVRRLEITENGVYDTIGYDEFLVNVIEEGGCEETIRILEDNIEFLKQEISIVTVERDELQDINLALETTIGDKNREIAQLEEENRNQFEQIDSVTSISITENGTYTPPIDVLGYNSIEVNVPLDSGDSIIYMKDYGLKFAYYKNEEIPDNFILDGVNDFSSMFYQCTKLKSVPEFDSSQSTTFYYTFYRCTALTTIPQLDTSKSTDFSYMFQNCTGLVTIPAFDTSLGNNLTGIFNGCTALTNIDSIDFGSKSTRVCIASTAFNGCSSLKTIGKINFTNLNTGTSMFKGCTALENMVVEGSINTELDFSSCTKLTYDSVKSILTACSNTTTPTKAKKISFNVTHTDQNGELAALIADCNTKGWTISGLIIN